MSLIDENFSNSGNSKKILTICIVAIIILIFIITGLLAYVTMIGGNKVKLYVDNKEYKASNYLISKDDVFYIGVEELSKMIPSNGYNFKVGTTEGEDTNKCYVTNGDESTFFEVDSNQIYKILADTNETEYYTLDHPVIKDDNGIIRIPIDAAKIAMNVMISVNKNTYRISSIGALKNYYSNASASKTFYTDDSIVWDTNFSNDKLLKEGLVIVKDSTGKLGIAKVSTSSDKKKKTTTVVTSAVVSPKYDSIRYVEKYSQLIVEVDGKKGIVKLDKDNFSVETLVSPQYEDISQINDELFLVSESSVVSEKDRNKVKKYGIVKLVDEEEEYVLPVEYDAIGIDISKFPNNGLTNQYIIYDNLIPVQKNGLWGLVNLKGKVVIKLEYTGLGCIGTKLSSNVLLVPEADSAIVVRKDNNYGIITKTNRVIYKNVLSRVYKENVDGKEQYSIIYNDEKLNLLNEYKKIKNNSSSETKNNTKDNSTSTNNQTTNKTTTTTTDNKTTTNKQTTNNTTTKTTTTTDKQTTTTKNN